MAPVNDAVRRIAAHPSVDASAALLLKMLSNITADPANPKFRRLRLANAKAGRRVMTTCHVILPVLYTAN
jgi:hypothetical protein